MRLTGRLSGSGLTLQPSGGLTLTIEDNEPEPKVTLVLTPDSIREDDGETTVTATLDSPSTEVTTITVTATPVAPAVAGDFRLIGTTLTIPPGATESTESVTIEAVDNDCRGAEQAGDGIGHGGERPSGSAIRRTGR